MNITWTILSKDLSTGSMVIEYSGDVSLQLNIPIPSSDKDLEEWVSSYLPAQVHIQQDLHEAPVGHSGAFTVEPPAAVEPSDVPNTTGSWNEEYLRAMIYQVLEEIKEAQV